MGSFESRRKGQSRRRRKSKRERKKERPSPAASKDSPPASNFRAFRVVRPEIRL